MIGYIYKITNIINNKVYIGQTSGTLIQRWKEHISRDKNKSRHYPLYLAFDKYGIDNFNIQLIEECNTTLLNEREIYWIEYYNSYSQGYNATIGGEGQCRYNYLEIAEFLKSQVSNKEAMKRFGCCREVITKVRQKFNIPAPLNTRPQETTISIKQLDKKTHQYIQTFTSIAMAARWLIENNATKGGKQHAIINNISNVCKNKNNSAYGYYWQYSKEE